MDIVEVVLGKLKTPWSSISLTPSILQEISSHLSDSSAPVVCNLFMCCLSLRPADLELCLPLIQSLLQQHSASGNEWIGTLARILQKHYGGGQLDLDLPFVDDFVLHVSKTVSKLLTSATSDSTTAATTSSTDATAAPVLDCPAHLRRLCVLPRESQCLVSRLLPINANLLGHTVTKPPPLFTPRASVAFHLDLENDLLATNKPASATTSTSSTTSTALPSRSAHSASVSSSSSSSFSSSSSSSAFIRPSIRADPAPSVSVFSKPKLQLASSSSSASSSGRVKMLDATDMQALLTDPRKRLRDEAAAKQEEAKRQKREMEVEKQKQKRIKAEEAAAAKAAALAQKEAEKQKKLDEIQAKKDAREQEKEEKAAAKLAKAQAKLNAKQMPKETSSSTVAETAETAVADTAAVVATEEAATIPSATVNVSNLALAQSLEASLLGVPTLAAPTLPAGVSAAAANALHGGESVTGAPSSGSDVSASSGDVLPAVSVSSSTVADALSASRRGASASSSASAVSLLSSSLLSSAMAPQQPEHDVALLQWLATQPRLPESAYSKLFDAHSRLTEANKQVIGAFIAFSQVNKGTGALPPRPPGLAIPEDNKLQLLVNEQTVIEPNTQALYVEAIYFELNYAANVWKKFKRMRKLE